MGDPSQPSPGPDPHQAQQSSWLDFLPRTVRDAAKDAAEDVRDASKEIAHDLGRTFVKGGQALLKFGEDSLGEAPALPASPSPNAPRASSAGGGEAGPPGQPGPAPTATPTRVDKGLPAPSDAPPPSVAEVVPAPRVPAISPPPTPPPIPPRVAATPAPPIPKPEPIRPVAPPARPAAAWQWQEIKETVDERWDDYSDSAYSVDGAFRLVAARVRGVGHEHEGLNCDDWYEHRQAGAWTLIAVADGAGSARLSRVGSYAACKGAIRRLEKELREHRLTPRDVWTPETFRRDGSTAAFGEADLEYVQNALHRAFIDAVDGIDEAVCVRGNSKEHIDLLGRPPRIGDFKTTLLLAVHTDVSFKGRDYSLVMACQIGDGLVAATSLDWRVRVLSKADHGEFGSETKFLTRGPDLDPVALARRTFPLFEPIRALFVMTDGVADIYFPPDPQVLRLHGDLEVNKVLPPRHLENAAEENLAMNEALERIGAPGLDELCRHFASAPSFQMNKVSRNGPGLFLLPLIGPFAERLGVEIRDVLASDGLTMVSQRLKSDIYGSDHPPSRLCNFLDSLEVRGQRDDRTLVVLHPAAPALIKEGGPPRP